MNRAQLSELPGVTVMDPRSTAPHVQGVKKTIDRIAHTPDSCQQGRNVDVTLLNGQVLRRARDWRQNNLTYGVFIISHKLPRSNLGSYGTRSEI